LSLLSLVKLILSWRENTGEIRTQFPAPEKIFQPNVSTVLNLHNLSGCPTPSTTPPPHPMSPSLYPPLMYESCQQLGTLP
jgi:hypothetical protein